MLPCKHRRAVWGIYPHAGGCFGMDVLNLTALDAHPQILITDT